MSAVQRDYIERMIEQFAQAIGSHRGRDSCRGFRPGSPSTIRRTSELVLGNLGPVLERLDAASVVDLIGKHDIDRVRMYAALLAEEGTIHELRGEAPRARYCYIRSLDLYNRSMRPALPSSQPIGSVWRCCSPNWRL